MPGWQAGPKLSFWLVCLPAVITYLHLRHVLQQSHLILVSRSRSSGPPDVHGIYQQLHNDRYVRIGISGNSRGWPSASQVARRLVLSSVREAWRTTRSSEPTLIYQSDDTSSSEGRWCLQQDSVQLACALPSPPAYPPPSGLWRILLEDTREPDAHAMIQVASYVAVPEEASGGGSSMTGSSTTNQIRRNPHKRRRPNRNLEFVADHPTTVLLLLLNVGLAFLYWNGHVAPSRVSKHYPSIIKEGQLWRALTGATAHFEPLHLGFNMMALFQLGAELEPLYGSLVFLLYNLSLTTITTVFMMLATYLRQRVTGRPGDDSSETGGNHSHTVGYSGVLFAWMVIASLEQRETCPVPFFPDLCFSTYNFGVVKFNLSPLVQLVVCQVIMPRVSLGGHLAGIVAGFLLHWNLLPLEVVQPAVLFPLLQLVYLWHVRQQPGVVSSRHANENNGSDEQAMGRLLTAAFTSIDASSPGRDSSTALAGRLDARQRKQDRDQSFHRWLVCVMYAMMVLLLLSLLIMDVRSSLIWAPLVTLVFYACGVASHALFLATTGGSSEAHHREKLRLGILWRGFIVSCILTILNDAMAGASWLVSSPLWALPGGWIQVGLMPACLLLTRLGVWLTSLSLVVKRLSDIGETGIGVFVHVFGWTVLENARVLGNILASMVGKDSPWTPFQGRGNTVGIAASPSSTTDNRSTSMSETL